MTKRTQVTPELLTRRLKALGFEQLDPEGPSGSTWIDPGHRNRPAVLVPREDQRYLQGFSELIEAATERIAWILEVSTDEAIRTICQTGDRFELRLVGPMTEGGRLPIQDSPKVVDGFLKLLIGGARAEFRGTQAYFTGPDTDEVREALDGIELLAPAEGSFKLVAVLSEQAQLPLDPENAVPDRPRRAVASTARGLHAAAQALRSPSSDADFLAEIIDNGVSTTLLGGLDLISNTSPDLYAEFTIAWDPDLPIPDSPSQSTISFRSSELKQAQRLAELLRPQEWEEHRMVSGWVKTASAYSLATEGAPRGYVFVETRFEGRKRSVLIELTAGDFARVRPGISKINARGTLERISGRWHLTNPRDVEIFPR